MIEEKIQSGVDVNVPDLEVKKLLVFRTIEIWYCWAKLVGHHLAWLEYCHVDGILIIWTNACFCWDTNSGIPSWKAIDTMATCLQCLVEAIGAFQEWLKQLEPSCGHKVIGCCVVQMAVSMAAKWGVVPRVHVNVLYNRKVCFLRDGILSRYWWNLNCNSFSQVNMVTFL